MTVVKKTENDLEEGFQWHKELDPDHIFEGELELINKLRDQIPELELETDKFVAVFLFSRRHNFDETRALLQRFFKKKAEYAHMFPGQHIPSFKYNPYLVDNMVNGGGSMLHPKGKRDNKFRMLRYFYMGLDKPAGREKHETYVSLVWQTYYLIQTEPLNSWRNGIAIIVDLKGAGLHNIDISAKGREVHSALQGVFPFRIRAMFVINGNWIVNALLTAAKIALPKKLYDRIKLMPEKALKDLIPLDNLSVQYGGTSDLVTINEWLKDIAKTEATLFEKGIWKAPDGATPALKLYF
jgi:hypothetical protein